MSARRQDSAGAEARDRLEGIYERVRRSFADNLATIESATEHLAVGDLDDAGRRAAESAAHRLVGAAAMVGFPEATEPARRLEDAFGGAAAGPDAVPRLRRDAYRLRTLLGVDRAS